MNNRYIAYLSLLLLLPSIAFAQTNVPRGWMDGGDNSPIYPAGQDYGVTKNVCVGTDTPALNSVFTIKGSQTVTGNIKILSGGKLIFPDGTGATSTSSFSGEINTASNAGTGTGQIFKQKSGVDLEFRNIHGQGSTTVSMVGDNVIIYSTDNVGGGEGSGSWTSSGGSIYPATISDKVGIGTTTPSTIIHIIGTSTADGSVLNSTGLTAGSTGLKIGNGILGAAQIGSQILLNNNDAYLYTAGGFYSNLGSILRHDWDGNVGTALNLYNVGAIPAGTSTGSAIDMWCYNGASQFIRYGRIFGYLSDTGSSTGNGIISITTMSNGTISTNLGSATVTLTNNRVGIGTTTPATTLEVFGTSTLSNLVMGTNTTSTYRGGHLYLFPASGTQTITNADIYALAGLGADGNIVTLLGDKVDAVNGTCTGLTLTNPTILGIFTFPGNGFTWAAGSSTLSSNGTMTVGTTDGSNANVVLDADGTGTHYLRRNNVDFDMRSIPRTLVTGSATVTGTTYGTVATFVIPAGALGANGMFELYGSFGKGNTDTSSAMQCNFVLTDGAATSTSVNAAILAAASMQNQAYVVFKNNGSAGTNTVQDLSATSFTSTVAAPPLTPNLNTGNTVTVYVQLRASSLGTASGYLSHGFCRYTFMP